MSSLKADFDELCERMRHGREPGHASFEPIYYLVFPPDQILTVKRQTVGWQSKLHQDGWDVYVFSIADNLWQIFEGDALWQLYLNQDRNAPLAWHKTNQSLAGLASGPNGLLRRLQDTLETLENSSNGLLLVTDLEALHPFMRIGALESQLQGQFHVPTIFLYPGVRTGKTRLKFLGFYPEDGNYRSVHVGG